MNINHWKKYQAIYIHIPFCVQKCLYCDFASYACCSDAVKEKYVDALCREIAQPIDLDVDAQATIYFGGGTPSTLDLNQLNRIIQALKKNGLWQRPIEASIEVNPGTVDLEKLQALRNFGFNRISIGIQSLNNEELRTIGRIHTAEQALEAIKMAKQAGFQRINADIIYGLPGQNMDSLRQTLSILMHTDIDHISVYGLIVEENTPLARFVESGKLSLPEDELAADMYDFVQDYLEEQGFLRYEISNYARHFSYNTKEGNLEKNNDLENFSYSRHNDVYWRYLPYAAFGASAASFNGRVRYTRPHNIEDYQKWVERLCNHPEPAYKEIAEALSQQELLGEFMIMGLRRLDGANLQEAKERFGVDVLSLYAKEIQPFLESGKLAYNANSKMLSLTSAGMAIGNQIFAIFV